MIEYKLLLTLTFIEQGNQPGSESKTKFAMNTVVIEYDDHLEANEAAAIIEKVYPRSGIHATVVKLYEDKPAKPM